MLSGSSDEFSTHRDCLPILFMVFPELPEVCVTLCSNKSALVPDVLFVGVFVCVIRIQKVTENDLGYLLYLCST